MVQLIRRLFLVLGGIMVVVILYRVCTMDYSCGVTYETGQASRGPQDHHATNPWGSTANIESNQSNILTSTVSYNRVTHENSNGDTDYQYEFNVPVPEATLPIENLLRNPWIKELKDFLKTLPYMEVTIVTSDKSYRHVLINWLISAMIKADSPLINILVISFDETVHNLMQSKGIPTVCIPPGSIVNTGFSNEHRAIFIARLTVVRLINYWGYDVVHYDTDAIVLKNPEPLFEEYRSSDIVGSVGRHPVALGDEWGFTLCMGAIMFRSTLQTDYFWRVVSTLGHFSKRQYNYDDQARVNYALKAMRIKWDKSDISIAASFGWTLKERLHVTALPTTQVCRTCKESGKSLYYIWHKRGQKDGESKIKTAEESGFWYLRNDWETVRTDARGALWLGQLALSTA